jgi:hypothetical protein
MKEPIKESSAPPPSTDTIVKHIHFVNEKKDVGLQLSRSDLPATSINNKSAQTRWTSTKTHPTRSHYSKGRYLRTMEDPLFDDPSIASYQPPALYFNSNSDFLQMMTPVNANYIDEAKENRLSYLASIPIDSFNDTIDFDDQDEDHDRKQKQPLKSKSGQTVRFNLPSTSPTPSPSPSTIPSGIKRIGQQQLLAKDFLSNFPLLRALVEEALTLQQHQDDIPVPIRRLMFDERPRSAGQQEPKKLKSSPTRPKSAATVRSTRTKSVILTRNINNTRRLYPPPLDTRQLVVTKHEVRNLVDRLSKPKFNKRFERQIALAEQMTKVDEPITTPRLTLKPTSTTVCHLYLLFIVNCFYYFSIGNHD